VSKKNAGVARTDNAIQRKKEMASDKLECGEHNLVVCAGVRKHAASLAQNAKDGDYGDDWEHERYYTEVMACERRESHDPLGIQLELGSIVKTSFGQDLKRHSRYGVYRGR
jgi:hypothetical protein